MPDYRDPAVSEVALDVVFHDGLDEAGLHALAEKLQPGLAPPQRAEDNELQIQVTPDGAQTVTTRRAFVGWRFDSGNWVVQAARSQFALAYVREKEKSLGRTYVGWGAVFERYRDLWSKVREQYNALRPRRVGLRYINRVAVPEGTPLDQWLNIGLSAPDSLKGIFAFQHRQTWEEIKGYPDLSVTINLAKVEPDDATRGQAVQAFILDIDLFNLSPDKAPRFAELPEWYTRAHAAENIVFESCITEELRAHFNKVTEHAVR